MHLSLTIYQLTNFLLQVKGSTYLFFISKKIILKKLKRAKTTQRIQRGEQKGKREEKRKTENKDIKKPAKTNHKEEN